MPNIFAPGDQQETQYGNINTPRPRPTQHSLHPVAAVTVPCGVAFRLLEFFIHGDIQMGQTNHFQNTNVVQNNADSFIS